jgi:hypothetical protein
MGYFWIKMIVEICLIMLVTSIQIQRPVHFVPFVHIEHSKSAQFFLYRIFEDWPIFLDILESIFKPAVPLTL